MKNITLSAPEELIEEARKQAAKKGTTLNEQFRIWLAGQAQTGQDRAQNYHKLMESLSHVNAGRTFTREEMNERR